jgi:hypothetical protein
MANIPIWPGSSSFTSVYNSFYNSGSLPSPTPFGFYDADPQFQADSNKLSPISSLIGVTKLFESILRGL